MTTAHSALFLDMGLGKTVSTLTAIKKLMFEELEIGKVLVIAPKRVAESVWSAEIDKWEHLQGLIVSKVIGTEKQRRTALAARAHIYLLGRDNVSWLCGQYGGSMVPFDMLIVDESSSFKNHSSVRFKALRAVLASFSRIVLLTGTPVPNGLADLWAQIYLLDRGERLGKFITNYRQKYFVNVSRSNQYQILSPASKKHEAEIHDKISDICISMKAEDYLELPGVVINDIDIIFPPKLQAAYDDFEREKVLELFENQEEGEEIAAMNAAALSNKLLQFANGAVYDEDKNYHVVHDLKLDAVEEIIENANGHPVLVAWTYRHDLYRMQEKLKRYKPRELKTDQDIKDWNAGEIQVLLMHPASGGHGLNLQAGGNIIVWFGQTWSSELYKQFNARLDRQGKKQVTIIHRLIARNTRDTDVIKVVSGKISKQDGLMEATKASIRKYVLRK